MTGRGLIPLRARRTALEALVRRTASVERGSLQADDAPVPVATVLMFGVATRAMPTISIMHPMTTNATAASRSDLLRMCQESLEK